MVADLCPSICCTTRWGLHGAEAIPKLRALRNGDFETYWRYHLGQEQRRVHQTRYADNLIPQAA